MPILYTMVGVPGAGKSTYIKNHPILQTLPIISTDVHVENFAKKTNQTYTEVFNDYMPTAIELMMVDVKNIRQKRIDCIWDQTSTTIASRRKKLKIFSTYRHIAVWLKTPPMDILEERLNNRPGKEIPKDVIMDMINKFEVPTVNEGFDAVWEIEYTSQLT